MRFFRGSNWTRRQRARRAASILAAVTIGGAALVGATGATAGVAVATAVPFSYESANPCVVPAEPFVGTGRLHLLLSENLSESGTAHSHVEANLQGLKAVTLSGKKYVVVDTTSQTLVFDTEDLAPFTTTWTWTVHYIRARDDGSTVLGGDDFYQHIVAHATVNANGAVSVERFTFDTRCR